MYVSISKREDVSKFSFIVKNIGNLQELFKLVVTPEGITVLQQWPIVSVWVKNEKLE